MQIRVLRDACCAADDQVGPLSKEMNLDGQASLQSLVDAIVASGFLQYSSTHTTMLGYVDDAAVVRVHSPYHSKEAVQFLIDPATAIQDAIETGTIDFRFDFSSKRTAYTYY